MNIEYRLSQLEKQVSDIYKVVLAIYSGKPFELTKEDKEFSNGIGLRVPDDSDDSDDSDETNKDTPADTDPTSSTGPDTAGDPRHHKNFQGLGS